MNSLTIYEFLYRPYPIPQARNLHHGVMRSYFQIPITEPLVHSCRNVRVSTSTDTFSRTTLVLIRNLPNNYPYNSTYGLFPLTVPSKIRDNLPIVDSAGREYVFERPGNTLVRVIQQPGQILAILGDPQNYPTPIAADIRKVTGGYG